MGAAGLIDIKRRIKSVENTRKITNAMGLVATSKLRKCKKELSTNQNFINLLEPIINNLLGAIVEENDSIYFNDNKSKDKLYIVITSETGLCGGFNSNIVSFLNNIVKDDKDHSKVLVVGSRGISYVRRLGIYITEEYVDLSETPTVKECKIIFEKALKMYLKKEVSEINIVYTKFTSPVKQDAVIEKILPLEKVEGEEGSYAVEPNPKVVLEETLNLYLKAKVRSVILNSKCSEQSSRMSAMNAATDNANDLLSDLNLKYNRIRQGMITQEISEIVGGAAAQN